MDGIIPPAGAQDEYKVESRLETSIHLTLLLTVDTLGLVALHSHCQDRLYL